MRVSADYFAVFGLHPILGRTLVPSDAEPGGDHVVILSHRLWASQFVTTLLYGLEPRDPRTLVQAAAVLAAVGALAGWLPAHRASRIDPAEVLRDS